jgi:LPXTG-motif cell wall-anchored protein
VTGPDANGVYTVIITNTTGVELPMTGGPGTLIYTLSGLMLIAFSVLMYGFRMRRRERRCN